MKYYSAPYVFSSVLRVYILNVFDRDYDVHVSTCNWLRLNNVTFNWLYTVAFNWLNRFTQRKF